LFPPTCPRPQASCAWAINAVHSRIFRISIRLLIERMSRTDDAGCDLSSERGYRPDRRRSADLTGDPMAELTMTRDELSSQARAIVAKHLKIDPATISDESGFLADLGADSVDFVELLMHFQEAFGVTIPDAEADDLGQFGAAVDYLAGKLAITA
jgi:acyl carrier protein